MKPHSQGEAAEKELESECVCPCLLGTEEGAEDREPHALSVQGFGLLHWDHTFGIQTCEIS